MKHAPCNLQRLHIYKRKAEKDGLGAGFIITICSHKIFTITFPSEDNLSLLVDLSYNRHKAAISDVLVTSISIRVDCDQIITGGVEYRTEMLNQCTENASPPG